MSGTTYSFQCPSCGEIVTDDSRQAYVTIMPKDGGRPRTYEICAECKMDLYALMEGRGEKIIEQLEQEEHIPTSIWGHHE